MCTITRGYQLLVDLVRIADKSALRHQAPLSGITGLLSDLIGTYP